MSSSQPVAPVIAVVGVTAAGKSRIAMTLADIFNGEIVCADSRTVYRGLDIGTAKPPAADRLHIPHHLLDVVDLAETITGKEFAILSATAIADIVDRSRNPIVVGGTRLFIETALAQVVFASEPSPEWLITEPLPLVHQRFQDAGVALPLNWHDRETLAAVWAHNRVSVAGPPKYPTLLLGVRSSPTDMVARVQSRVDAMFAAGLETEVRNLCDMHSRSAESLYSIGYEEWHLRFTGSMTLDEVCELMVAHTLTYAARQSRWLGSLPNIVWVANAHEAVTATAAFFARQPI